MRKNILYLLLILTAMHACKKETDPLFDKSPDERINDTLRQYQDILTQSPFGWKALVYPAGAPKTVFSFYIRFNDSNRVQMFSDLDQASTNALKESSWRLKALQQPSLLFDTYSYLHVLCDPDAAHNGGIYGQGLGSDFEFAINGLHADTLELTGRFNGSRAFLVKATQQEREAYYQHQINRSIDSMHNILTYFKKLATATGTYDIGISTDYHLITFTWISEGKVRSVTTGYYYTPQGIALSPAFNDGTTTIQKLDNISWASGEVKCTINNQPAAITETVKPVALDGAAPKRWYQFALDQKRYWVTENGFHVNGVDDAFGIKKLPGYLFATYWPLAGGAGSGIDAFGFVVPDGEQPTLMYGAIYSAPTFSKDGRIIFNDLRLFGDLPPDRTPVDRSRALMADPAGYFLVQTAAGRYDMVSAKDGKSWITWVF